MLNQVLLSALKDDTMHEWKKCINLTYKNIYKCFEILTENEKIELTHEAYYMMGLYNYRIPDSPVPILLWVHALKSLKKKYKNAENSNDTFYLAGSLNKARKIMLNRNYLVFDFEVKRKCRRLTFHSTLIGYNNFYLCIGKYGLD